MLILVHIGSQIFFQSGMGSFQNVFKNKWVTTCLSFYIEVLRVYFTFYISYVGVLLDSSMISDV